MKIPVLMYHDIREDNYSLSLSPPENRPYIQKKSQFKAQIEYLKNNGFSSLVVADLAQPTVNFPQKSVAITFDDGDLSNYDYAFPLLSGADLKGTFFITTDFVGKEGYVQWSHLREMQKGGMEIGSHTVTHPIPSLLSTEQFVFELQESKKTLEDELGVEVKSFSLPTGFYNQEVTKLAKEFGYSCVCTSRTGLFSDQHNDCFDIRRMAIKRGTSMNEFVQIVNCSRVLMLKKGIVEQCKKSVQVVGGPNGYNYLRSFLLRGRR